MPATQRAVEPAFTDYRGGSHEAAGGWHNEYTAVLHSETGARQGDLLLVVVGAAGGIPKGTVVIADDGVTLRRCQPFPSRALRVATQATPIADGLKGMGHGHFRGLIGNRRSTVAARVLFPQRVFDVSVAVEVWGPAGAR